MIPQNSKQFTYTGIDKIIYNNSIGNYSVIPQADKREKTTLLFEIDNILEELEYFEKERRKNQLISIMKAVVRNVDEKTIPESNDLLDFRFFGKTEYSIEEEFILNKKSQKNLINNINNFSKENISNFNFDKNLYNDDLKSEGNLLLNRKKIKKYNKSLKISKNLKSQNNFSKD